MLHDFLLILEKISPSKSLFYTSYTSQPTFLCNNFKCYWFYCDSIAMRSILNWIASYIWCGLSMKNKIKQKKEILLIWFGAVFITWHWKMLRLISLFFLLFFHFDLISFGCIFRIFRCRVDNLIWLERVYHWVYVYTLW